VIITFSVPANSMARRIEENIGKQLEGNVTNKWK